MTNNRIYNVEIFQQMKGLVGQKFGQIIHNSFFDNGLVHAVIGVEIGGNIYKIENRYQTFKADDFEEEFGQMTFSNSSIDELAKISNWEACAKNIVGQTITKILIYCDTHSFAKDGTPIMQYEFVRAIVFCFDNGLEFVAENNYPFDFIAIQYGEHARQNICSAGDFVEDWEKSQFSISFERTITEL